MKEKKASLAKISLPKITGVLQRKRLFKLLDEKRKKPVVYISGPPGSGKTTLIASYLTARKLPCIWYQVDEGDGDIASFFHYMAIAAKQAAPRYRRPLPNLTPEYLLGLPTFTRNYFRELYSRLLGKSPRRRFPVSPFLVVLDNYQDAPANSPLHEIIQTGLSEMPEGINVIVISRIEPPSAFAGLRANNRINILGWDELKLSTEETNGIVQLKVQKKLSKEVIQELHNKTNGWASGLTLMLEHKGSADLMQRHGSGFTTQAMFGYFAGEIFQKLDAASQEILLQSAFLPVMTGRLAQQLTGSHQAGELLSELNRRNYFTIRKSLPEPVYQYHPLFREFLLAQARQQLTDAQLTQTQRKAAEILEGAGQFEDAIILYSHTGDWQSMARIILANAQVMIAQGRTQTLEGWLKTVPEAIQEQQPWLLYWLGVCLLPFNPQKSRSHSERAFELFRINEDVSGIFLSWSLIVESILHELGNLKELDKWLFLLDELLLKYNAFPSEAIEAQVAPKFFLSLVMRNAGHPEFNKWKERTHTVLENGADATLRMFAGFYLLTYYIWIGDYAKTVHILETISGIARSKNALPLAKITVKMAESWYQWLTGSFRHSLKTMSDALEIAKNSGVHIWDYLLIIQGVAASLSVGDIQTAEGLLKKISSALDRVRRFDRFYYYHEMAWYFLLRHDTPSSLIHQETALSLAKEVGVLFIEAQAHLGMAHLMHIQADHKKAEDHLLQAQDIGRRMGSGSIEFTCLLKEAQFAIDSGDEKRGLKSLSNAMALGKKQGYINFSWWLPSVMSRTCAIALEHNIEIDYVMDLIRKRNLLPPEDARGLENWPWPLKIYTMGRFTILKDEKPIRFAGKAQNKPIELLKALLALGGRDVLEEQLTDVLYPQADGDAAHIALATTLKRLRQLIEYKDAIELKEGRLTLNPAYAWVDNWAFERLCSQADAAEKSGQSSKAHELCNKAINLYHGHFLGRGEESWAVSLRERLRSKFMRHIEEIGRYWENDGQLENAVEYYQKAIDVDDLEEIFYQRLMLAYQRLGRPNDAINVYQRCLKTLTAVGMKPSPAIEALKAEAMKGKE